MIQIPVMTSADVNNNRNNVRQTLMKCCVLNAQSLRNKSVDFVDYVLDCKPDVVAVTETWFTPIDTAAIE